MAIGLETFQNYVTNHEGFTSNVIVNKEHTGLTTTKARGGVFGLAGLLNIGKRAKYGRETLSALKDALVSEFKNQNGLSAKESESHVDEVFKKAFKMDFKTAYHKAIKINRDKISLVLEKTRNEIAALNRMGKSVATEKLTAETFIENSERSQTGTIRGNPIRFNVLQFDQAALIQKVAKMRRDLNYQPCTPQEAKDVSDRLGWTLNDLIEDLTRLSDDVRMPEKADKNVTVTVEGTGEEFAEDKQTMNKIIADLKNKVNRRVSDLNKMFVMIKSFQEHK